MAIESINPSTGERIEKFEEETADQIEGKLKRAAATFRTWRESSFDHRAQLMRNAAKVLRDRVDAYARMITQEMGKPIVQAVAEIYKCAGGCEYYADNASAFLSERIVPTESYASYVRYDPLGPVLAIMPWNFPFWQVFRFAVPGLMAGNVGLLKHASNVPQSALAIEEIFLEAGFPEGAFTTLLISAAATEGVIRDRRVVAVTLTGSEMAGKKVASTAGDVLKKTLLELGGSDPFIVLADADLDRAADVAVQSRLVNNGQSCIAAKRFIVLKKVAQAFTEKFRERLAAVVVGDPMDEGTQVGPMARPDLRDELHNQVVRSIDQGATCELGGTLPEGPGYYYPVSLLTGVRAGMPCAIEETFGPLASVAVVEDEEQAIAMANDSEYGLGGSIWTADLDRARSLVSRIESGTVGVNAFVKSDSRLPFGGVKKSGYGRELAIEGIHEFVNVKTVLMEE